MDLYEVFVVIPSYKEGKRQPLIELLQEHKRNGKAPSQDIFDLLIEIAKKANIRKRGASKKIEMECRIRESIWMASVLEPSASKKELFWTVAKKHGVSVRNIERIVYPKKKPSPRST